jgi:hypothetical protein
MKLLIMQLCLASFYVPWNLNVISTRNTTITNAEQQSVFRTAFNLNVAGEFDNRLQVLFQKPSGM